MLSTQRDELGTGFRSPRDHAPRRRAGLPRSGGIWKSKYHFPNLEINLEMMVAAASAKAYAVLFIPSD